MVANLTLVSGDVQQDTGTRGTLDSEKIHFRKRHISKFNSLASH